MFIYFKEYRDKIIILEQKFQELESQQEEAYKIKDTPNKSTITIIRIISQERNY